MKKIFLFAAILICINAKAQLPDTDIFLSDVKGDAPIPAFSKAVNLTSRKGYDNQPSFSADGSKMFFVSIIDTMQSDVYCIDLKTKKKKRLTKTKESEYSPALSPDGKHFTVVRVDADSGQRLYNIPAKKTSKAILIPHSDSVGYYCWLTDTSVAMFVLGDPFTLQILNTVSGQRRVVASNIGRCLKKTPDGKELYYLDKSDTANHKIRSLRINDGFTKDIAPAIAGSEDFEIYRNGKIIMGQNAVLFQFDNGDWKQLKDFSSDIPGFYRLTFNKAFNLLALVAYTGVKP